MPELFSAPWRSNSWSPGIRGEARTTKATFTKNGGRRDGTGNKRRRRRKSKPRTQQEMRMKTIATTAFALVLSTSFALAQASQTHGGASTGWMNSSASSERPGMNFGVRNSETTEPGDFATTDGLSNRSRAWNPTGQVDPGTSNSPAGNAGGE
jgi:hypothetical protein